MKNLFLVLAMGLIALTANAQTSIYGGFSNDAESIIALDDFIIGGNYFFNPENKYNFGVDLNYKFVSDEFEDISIHPLTALGIVRTGKKLYAQAGLGLTYTMVSVDNDSYTSENDLAFAMMAGGGINLNEKFNLEARATTNKFDIDNVDLAFLVGYRF